MRIKALSYAAIEQQEGKPRPMRRSTRKYNPKYKADYQNPAQAKLGRFSRLAWKIQWWPLGCR